MYSLKYLHLLIQTLQQFNFTINSYFIVTGKHYIYLIYCNFNLLN